MNRLFEDPASHPVQVVAPAVGAETVGASPEFDEGIIRLADAPGVDLMLDPPPEGREPQLVAHGEEPASLASEFDEPGAVLHAQGHRLFQEEVAVGLKDVVADLEVQVGGEDDTDDVEVLATEHFGVIRVNPRLFMLVLRPGLARVGAGRDGNETGPGRLGDGSGVMASPGSVTDQSEPNFGHRILPAPGGETLREDQPGWPVRDDHIILISKKVNGMARYQRSGRRSVGISLSFGARRSLSERMGSRTGQLIPRSGSFQATEPSSPGA